MKVVFFGTPAIARVVLEALCQEPGIEVVAVVTKPDKPQGRSLKMKAPPVKELALEKNIPVYQPQKASHSDFAEVLRPLNADIFVVIAYSEILKPNLLGMPRLGCVNIHGSLLPKYRGAAPIQRCIMAGEQETGVTIMKMSPELDAGEMLAVEKIPIPPDMTAGELFTQMGPVGAKALIKVLHDINEGKAKSLPQDHSQSTYAPKITPEDGRLDWKKPAQELYNQFRGVTPKPGAWAWIEVRGEKKRLLVKKMSITSEQGAPGSILSPLVIATTKGSLRLEEVQLEGKKSLSADEFCRGISINDFKMDLIS